MDKLSRQQTKEGYSIAIITKNKKMMMNLHLHMASMNHQILRNKTKKDTKELKDNKGLIVIRLTISKSM